MIPDGVKVMDMSFDVRKVFQERLASSMGLDKYRYIMEQVSITNVAIDTDFQRTFNGFYVVRRNESCKCYSVTIESKVRIYPIHTLSYGFSDNLSLRKFS